MTPPDEDWQVGGDHHHVRAHSAVRLAFEPKAGMRAYRAALRMALRALEPVDGQGLVATYFSPDNGFVDVENVLLYNVGQGCYAHTLRSGLFIARHPSRDAHHRLHHEIGPLPEPAPGGELLATVEAPLPAVLPHSPGGWWALLRPHVQPLRRDHDGSFALDITLTGRWPGTRVASATKTMLDGLISALHQHDGTHSDTLPARLYELGDPEQAWTALCDPAYRVIGPARALVHAHGQRIAWNPADDLCAEVRIATTPSTDAPTLHAEVRAAC